jgi:hypothetical protein
MKHMQVIFLYMPYFRVYYDVNIYIYIYIQEVAYTLKSVFLKTKRTKWQSKSLGALNAGFILCTREIAAVQADVKDQHT